MQEKVAACMHHKTIQPVEVPQSKKLQEVAISCLKLGTIGFGGIAGMVATIENEMVVKRKWIDHQHFLDVLSASYIIPGPNAVEIVMHCGKERAGRAGLVLAGICYIVPAMLICMVFGYFYKQYSALPNVQQFMVGLRPAITALVLVTVWRLAAKSLKNDLLLALVCILVFAGALVGINEVILILAAGLLNYLLRSRVSRLNFFPGFLFTPVLLQINTKFAGEKLFFIFLKIGAVLYGSGYVLFGYMDEALVQHHHWLTRQQLVDAIAVGQITPGPILSSATFAGYLMQGPAGALLATIGVFLPAFIISFFLHSLLTTARKNNNLRLFLNGLSAASIAIIAVVGLHLLQPSLHSWRDQVILFCCLLLLLLVKKINTMIVVFAGAVGGFLLLHV